MFKLIRKGRFYIGLLFFTVRFFRSKKYTVRNVNTKYGKRRAYVFYTPFPLLDFKGMSFAKFVWIDKRSQYDIGLHAHELTHVRQFYEEGLKIVRVLWSKKYELKLEIEAYVAQIRTGASILSIAKLLANNYSFSKKLSERNAARLLTASL